MSVPAKPRVSFSNCLTAASRVINMRYWRRRRRAVLVSLAVIAFVMCITVQKNFMSSAPVYDDSDLVVYSPHEVAAGGALREGTLARQPRAQDVVLAPPGNASSMSDNIWPDPVRPLNDRIIAQMNYRLPKHVARRRKSAMKSIFLPGGFEGEKVPGQKRFLDDKCLVNKCRLTGKYSEQSHANAILFSDGMNVDAPNRAPYQIWIVFLLESPENLPISVPMGGMPVNWTATYRPDSTIVTPYEKFVPFKNVTSLPAKANRNYAIGRSQLVAWFVSNCDAGNDRLQYAEMLQKHVTVDIYGDCGNMRCSRSDADECFSMLRRRYKFYLSFENTNCRHYITEKFFQNALWNDVVPIVMGAPREDYEAVAPPGSFIHVDDFSSPAELGKYLLKLDADDDAYNAYFRWKGTGEFINTKFWCRLCAMLHAADYSPPHYYENVQSWWQGNGTCTKGRWTRPLATA